MKIIFAQGNPEPDYDNTRHNIGFMILNQFAHKLDLKWDEKTKFKAIISELNINNEKTLLVKPTSYYNETGPVIQKLLDFYKISTNNLLVIHDDLSLPFGTIRIREKGSDAGNNGIKSVNQHIGPNYRRVRFGINTDLREKMQNDADFVLSKFTKNEINKINTLIAPKAIELIDQFCLGEINPTSHSLI